MIISVTVKDKDSRLVKEYNLEAEHPAQIKELHDEASCVWDDFWVTFRYGNDSFIYGYPYAMARDEQRLEDGELSFESYLKKWYNHI